MADIKDVVIVNISRETRTISQAGFGIPLILGPNGSWAACTVREYSDIDEVAEDFETTDGEYKAANRMFSQSPRPEKVKISVENTKVAQVQTITLSADLITGNEISVDIDGVTISEEYASSHNSTMTAFAALIQAEAGVATAVASGRVITVTAQKAGIPVLIENAVITGGDTQATIVVATTTPNYGIADDLNEIIKVDNTWYALATVTRDVDEVMQAAEWIEAKDKIYGTTTADANCKNAGVSTDIMSLLKARGYTHTFVCYNETASDCLAEGWLGRCLPEEPGAITWRNKDVVGPVVSNLTDTEIAAIKGKNGNLLVERGGVRLMENGTMASGEFIDIIRDCVHWVAARMAENIFTKIVTSPKIPYTTKGISIIENGMHETMREAIRRGIFAANPDAYDNKDYYLSVPNYADIPRNDKAARELNGCEWEATPAGAIHTVRIAGRVVI